MVERAGILRRGVAALVDLLLAQIVLVCLVALLYAVSGGRVTTGNAFFTSCRPVAAAPAGVALPTDFVVTSQSLCTSGVLAPTRTLYVARQVGKAGTVPTRVFTVPTSPDGTAAVRELALDWLLYPLFILLRWSGDRFLGGSLGRRLVGIAVTDEGGTATGAALAGPLARRYARFAWIYGPGAMAVALDSAIAAATGASVPALTGLIWLLQNALIGAAQIVAMAAIYRRGDTFYDAPCGTAVATRLEIARARDMNPGAIVASGPSPGRDLLIALRRARRSLPWLSLGLAALMAAVYAGEVLLPYSPATSAGVSIPTLMAWGGMDRELAILLVQPYRLVTAMFVHGSLVHLIVNVSALLIVGVLIERPLGPLLFGFVFLAGGLAGAAASIIVNPPELISVGASGGVLALFAAALPLGLVAPAGDRRRWLVAWPITVCIPAIMPGLPLPGGLMVDRADHAGGEIAGLVLGCLLALIWRKGVIRRPSRRAALVVGGALAGVVCATVAIGGVRAPMQAAVLVPPGEAPKDDAGWGRQASTLARHYPDDPRVRFGLALHEAESGLATQAVADLEVAIAEQRTLSPVRASGFRTAVHSAVGAAFFDAGDLDDAIGQYTAALAETPQAALYRQRGVSEFYRGRGAEAVADFRQALTINRNELYSVLWLSIAAARTGVQDPIDGTSRDADLGAWPGPVVRFYAGRTRPDTLEATAGLLDLAANQNRVCEVAFYEAESHMMRREFDAARPLLRTTVSTCPETFIEHRAALEELAGHAGLPPQ